MGGKIRCRVINNSPIQTEPGTTSPATNAAIDYLSHFLDGGAQANDSRPVMPRLIVLEPLRGAAANLLDLLFPLSCAVPYMRSEG